MTVTQPGRFIVWYFVALVLVCWTFGWPGFVVFFATCVFIEAARSLS